MSLDVCRRRAQVLDLSANEIQAIPPLSGALPALAELIIDDNAIRALGDELRGLPKLKKLSARCNRIAAVDPFTGQQARRDAPLPCFCLFFFYDYFLSCGIDIFVQN